MPANIVPGPGWRGNDEPQPLGEQIVDWSTRDLNRSEPPREIVKNVLSAGSVCLLSGRSTNGKTTLMLDLMMAAATGGPWLGMEVTPCRSFGWFCEDSQARLDAIVARLLVFRGVHQPDIEGRMQTSARVEFDDSTLFRWNDRAKQLTPTMLWEQLNSPMLGILEGVQIMILDTIGDVLIGSLNDGECAKAVVKFLTRWAREHQGVAILVTHPPEDAEKSYTGAKEWHTKPRNHIHLARRRRWNKEMDVWEHPDGDRRFLHVLKNSYGPKPAPIPITWSSEWQLFVLDEYHALPERERMDLL